MSTLITSWLRAYEALQSRTLAARGAIVLNSGADDARWPRTIGADVIAIGAVLDPHVRALSSRFGGAGIARRWRAAMDDIETIALHEPYTTYVENRSFWRTLSSVCVHLHSEGAALPAPAIWDALLSQLSETIERRNAGPKGDGPFQHFDAKTYDDLFTAQLKHLRALRGSDDMNPDAGMTGGKKPIPRTTNGDVVLLADYWSRQLAAVKDVFGAAGVKQRWQAALADVDATARTGDPNALYPKNNGFWRVLQQTAIHVAAADEAPTKTDLMLDAIRTSLVELPNNLKAGAKAIADGASNLAGNIAHGVGQVAHEAGKGLFGGFGTPMLIGAGLVGLFLITRNANKETQP